MKGRGILSLWLVAIWLPTGTPMLALPWQDPVSATCGISRDRITVGDPVDLLVQVNHPPDYRVGPPVSPLDFGKLELLDEQVLEAPAGKDASGTLFRFRITAFEPGEFTTPRIPIPYLATGEEEVREVICEPLQLQVDAVLEEDASDLRDIKQPLDLPAEGLSWWVWGLLPLLLAGLAFWLWKRRSRGIGGDAVAAVPALPPYPEAMAALRRLEEQELPQKGETQRHYVELSTIIRRYIHRRFGIEALEMTSGQILRELRLQAVSTEPDGRLSGLLGDCDLVKFARLEPSFERNRKLLETARMWLESTRPFESEGDAGETEEVEEQRTS